MFTKHTMAESYLFFAVLFISIVMADTENTECSYAREVLSRLTEMEIKLRLFEENNNRFQKQHETFNANWTALQQRILTETTPLVAFSAYNPHDRTPESGQVILFRNTYLNAGRGYDTLYGVFTAPVRGLYQFSAQFCNQPGKAVAFSIYLDRNKIAVSTVGDDNDSGCTSLTTLTMMEFRQTVTVRSEYEFNELREDEHRKASFTGLLLHI